MSEINQNQEQDWDEKKDELQMQKYAETELNYVTNLPTYFLIKNSIQDRCWTKIRIRVRRRI